MKKIKQEKLISSSFSKNEIIPHKVTVKTTLMKKKVTNDKIFNKSTFNSTTNQNKKPDITHKTLNTNTNILKNANAKKNISNSSERNGIFRKIKIPQSKLENNSVLDKTYDTNNNNNIINESNNKNNTQNLLNTNNTINASNYKSFRVLR